tara:strand:- start:193 stop:474 length:282 start_codon:yes stop_codon:yes gene_type:complete
MWFNHYIERKLRKETAMSRYDTDLWKALEQAQNLPAYSMVDILTITEFMDDEAFKKHALRYTTGSHVTHHELRRAQQGKDYTEHNKTATKSRG